ncbi:MAG: DUF1554 domain-containing protein [Bdellovibrionota bacterium]|nr:DUF1554 domain-containing protein [Bdellovibrionota bacterium]
MKQAHILTVSLMILISGCLKKKNEEAPATGTGSRPGTGATPTPTPTPAPGRYGVIFQTPVSVNGSGAQTGLGSGLTTLDNLCSTAATNKGLTGTFKALVGAGSSRRACTSANCSGGPAENSNWVILGKTEFRREDKATVIGTTTASGIFSFPLTNSFRDSATDYWSGLNADWTGSGAQYNCNAWTINDNSQTANLGDTGVDTSASLYTAQQDCDQTNPVLCVEQVDPPAQEDYRIIFATANTYQGGSGFLNADGVNDFDNICRTEALQKGLIFSTYKALIFADDESTRYSCYSAYCSDQGIAENRNWILEANTEYRREDGTTVIASTNAAAIFDFPLQNSITGNASDEYWTGIAPTFAFFLHSQKTCDNFGLNYSSYSGWIGNGAATTSAAISDGSEPRCNTYKKILCVEQAR